jgi:hypothetical protein
MAVIRTIDVSGAGIRPSSIEDEIARGRRYLPRWVGHSVQAVESPSSRLARAEVAVRMISKPYLFKRTYGPEMHFMLQSIEVTH